MKNATLPPMPTASVRQAMTAKAGRASHLAEREREVLTQDVPVCGGRRFQNVEGDRRGGLSALGEIVAQLAAVLVAHVAREEREEQAVAERQLAEWIVGASHGFEPQRAGRILSCLSASLTVAWRRAVSASSAARPELVRR